MWFLKRVFQVRLHERIDLGGGHHSFFVALVSLAHSSLLHAFDDACALLPLFRSSPSLSLLYLSVLYYLTAVSCKKAT